MCIVSVYCNKPFPCWDKVGGDTVRDNPLPSSNGFQVHTHMQRGRGGGFLNPSSFSFCILCDIYKGGGGQVGYGDLTDTLN